MDLNISSESAHKIKCFLCQNYLSYFPISLCCNNQSVCGRCHVPEAMIAFQNEAFEILCQSVKFPCRYEPHGCTEELVPNDVPQHEEKCPFRVVSCIISSPEQCKWEGSGFKLEDHCRREHSNIFFKDGEFTIDLSTAGEWENFVDHNGTLYVFATKFLKRSPSLSCAVYSINYEAECSVAHINIKKAPKTVSIELKTTTFKEKTYTELDLSSIVEKIDNLVLGQVEISSSESTLLDEKTNSVLLSLIKCIACHQYIKRSIYRSSKNSQPYCSVCAVGIDVDEALDLKKITDLVKYPCKYLNSGCTFSSKQAEMVSHEQVCQYEISNCPLRDFCRCSSTILRKDLNDHISKTHQDYICSSGDTLDLLETNSMRSVLVRFAGHFFRLVYNYEEESFFWILQSIDDSEENFKYQVEIIDDNSSPKALMMHNCAKLAPINKIFTKCLEDCISFKKNQIRRLIKKKNGKDCLTFRVYVLKS